MFSPLAVPDPASDPLGLPRKYVDGLTAFAELWQGPLTLVLPQASKRDDNLDYITIHRAGLPFEVRAFPDAPVTLRDLIQSAAVVLAPMLYRYVQIPALCSASHVPFVLDADITPAVREEIIRAENKNPLLRWRRLLWQRNMEHHYTAMVRAAQGVQLLGPTAFETYAPLNPSALMYFDTRVRRAMLPTTEQIQARTERLRSGAPLRLIYSGRWRAMKGVMDLPSVAAELRRLGVNAQWDIFGGGMLQDKLERAITNAGLDNMRLRGEIPFPELMRFVGDECDLFVCCHRQGDPSTTFIEMLSVGVPLVGYDTSGLRGIVALSGAGWLTPLDNATALAARIMELERNRDELVQALDAAARYTKNKSFEDMMQQRVTHLRAIATGSAQPNGAEGQSI